MSKFEPTYSKGVKFENKRTGDRYVVQDMEYNKRLCDIVYKLQHYRMKFDMFKAPEKLVCANVNEGTYKVIEQ